MIFDQESILLQKGFQRLESISLDSKTERGACFLTQAGPLKVSFFSPGIVRFQIGTNSAPDYDILIGEAKPVEVEIKKVGENYLIEHLGIAVELLSAPLRICISSGEKVILQSSTDRDIQGSLRFAPFAQGIDDEWLCSFSLESGEPVYGLGEKFGPLNRRGCLINSWNLDALGVNAEASYKNAPFAWSPNGWGIFVHTPARVTHGVGYPQWSHRSYVLKIHDSTLDIFFILAESPEQILEKYTELTGRSPSLPVWSYGVWMGRAFYRNAEEVLEVAKKLRERKIPCDVILLDGRAWHKMETRFDFQWDPERYPDPKSFVQLMGEAGFRICLWEYPYISSLNPLYNLLAQKGYLLRTTTGKPYLHKWLPEPYDKFVPHLLPSGIVDLTNPEAYEWYRDMHQDLFDIGVSVMKPDYGEAVPEDIIAHNGDKGKRVHNVYALLYNRCVYEATKMYGTGEPIVWGRAGWTGSQRYPIQWGGDPQCDWEGLAASIRGGLSWGMSGGPFYAHDIGGFSIGKPEPELYIRWAQAGVLCSHTRFHGIGVREPWEYGEEAEQIVQTWLELRYRMIPYLKSCEISARQTGMPVLRAMPLVFPNDPGVCNFDLQYMLGPSLLVAPVLQPGGRVSIYIPEGRWYGLFNGECLEGPCIIKREVPLDYIPVYGREGHFLPLGSSVQFTFEISKKQVIEEIWAFGIPESSTVLPGISLDLPALHVFNKNSITKLRVNGTYQL